MTVHLEWSDSNCRLDGEVYDKVPLMMDEHYEVVEPATDWFRNLTINNTSTRSVRQYAFTLASFWRFLAREKRSWRVVTNAVLRKWRSKNSSRLRRKVKRQTWNNNLSVILRFYVWAQENGYISEIIGECDDAGKKPPITIWWETTKYRKVIRSELHYRGTGITYKPVPTKDEMDDAYAELSRGKDSALATRNVLMLRWAEAGLRRAEFASLRISELPSISQILDMERDDKACNLAVKGKGEKRRVMAIDPELIVSTLDYVDQERQEVVEKAGSTFNPDVIFISHRTARPLGLTYISQVLSGAFRNSENSEGLSGHRARARHLTNFIEVMLDEHEESYGTLNSLHTETILFRAAEQAGHSDLNSMRFYLSTSLKRRQEQRIQERKQQGGKSSIAKGSKQP